MIKVLCHVQLYFSPSHRYHHHSTSDRLDHSITTYAPTLWHNTCMSCTGHISQPHPDIPLMPNLPRSTRSCVVHNYALRLYRVHVLPHTTHAPPLHTVQHTNITVAQQYHPYQSHHHFRDGHKHRTTAVQYIVQHAQHQLHGATTSTAYCTTTSCHCLPLKLQPTRAGLQPSPGVSGGR